MNAVENALRIIRFDSPEWIPATMPIHHISFHRSLDTPYVHGQAERPQQVGETLTDIWGVGVKKVRDAVGGTFRIPSIPTPDKLKSFRWPDANDDYVCEQIYQQAKDFREATYGSAVAMAV